MYPKLKINIFTYPILLICRAEEIDFELLTQTILYEWKRMNIDEVLQMNKDELVFYVY